MLFEGQRNTLIETLGSISKKLVHLSKMNDQMVEVNEAIGSQLVGFGVNAWCVHFKHTMTEKQIDELLNKKLEHKRQLENELTELKNKLNAKNRQSQFQFQFQNQSQSQSQVIKRKEIMPPPKRPIVKKRLSKFENMVDRLSRPRTNPRKIQKGKKRFTPGLNLNMAHKSIRADETLTSSDDSIVVSQTSDKYKRAGPRREWDRPWQIKGRKPFR